MEKQSSFADRLKKALAMRNVTKADLSRMTGISKSSLTHYEKGDWEGKQDAVYKIARALNVPESWLMGFASAEDFFPNNELPSGEEKPPSGYEGRSEKDQRLINWFRSLPPEKQQAILIAQDGPTDAL